VRSLVSIDLRRDGGWFRLAGWGLSLRDLRTYTPPFSERHGDYAFDLGPWRFKVLRP